MRLGVHLPVAGKGASPEIILQVAVPSEGIRVPVAPNSRHHPGQMRQIRVTREDSHRSGSSTGTLCVSWAVSVVLELRPPYSAQR